MLQLQLLTESIGGREKIQVLKTKSSTLSDLMGVAARGALVLSTFQHISQMDAPSYFVFGLEHKTRQRRMVHSLQATEIHQRAVDFNKDLYRIECREEREVELSFLEDLTEVSDEHNRKLEVPLLS